MLAPHRGRFARYRLHQFTETLAVRPLRFIDDRVQKGVDAHTGWFGLVLAHLGPFTLYRMMITPDTWNRMQVLGGRLLIWRHEDTAQVCAAPSIGWGDCLCDEAPL